MAAVMPVPATSRVLMSVTKTVARAAWEAGVKVAAAYPGTLSTEMLEVISTIRIRTPSGRSTRRSAEVAIGAARRWFARLLPV